MVLTGSVRGGRALAAAWRRRSASTYLGRAIAGFTDAQEQLRGGVEQFCAAELGPRAAQVDRDNQFPGDMWKKMGEFGLLGVTAPEASTREPSVGNVRRACLTLPGGRNTAASVWGTWNTFS